MKITFELTKMDGKEARRNYYAHLRPRSDRYIHYFLGVLGLLFIFTGLRGPVRGSGLHNFSGWFPLVIGPLFLLESWFLAKRGPIYSFRLPARAGPQTLDISERGITIGSPGRFAESTLSWNDFSRSLETENLFLLLSLWPSNVTTLFAYRIRGTPRSVYVFPKRAFAAGEAEQFRSLLKTHVPQTASR